MAEQPWAFHDLPADAFPVTLDLLDAASREVRWTLVLDGPGALRVPSRDEINGGLPVTARVTFADGTVNEAGPGG
jgi:hypothetical protein